MWIKATLGLDQASVQQVSLGGGFILFAEQDMPEEGDLRVGASAVWIQWVDGFGPLTP